MIGALARVVRARFQRWLLNRLPATDSWLLTQRNIYILPTKAGFAFALTLLLMLVAAINYQLNLGYVLTFLLAGAGAVSMHLTHGTLRGLTLQLRTGPTGFAGEPALLDVVISNPGGQRHALALRFHDRSTDQTSAGRSFAWCDVPAQGQALTQVSMVPGRRGGHAVPPLVVETVFPFGLFRAWSLWRPAARVLAWPAPETPLPPLPPAQPIEGQHAAAQRSQGSETEGVRHYRRGDSPRQVVWKKVASSGQLVSRDTNASASRTLWLDWAGTPGAGTEQRLSRLAAWVQASHHSGQPYGLRLPGHELAMNQGEAHRRAALDLLAGF